MPARVKGRQAVILCTAAGARRAGDGNFGSNACRALASAGVPALRFDFHGYGESTDPPGGELHVYETDRCGELRAAAEVLRARGFDDIVAVGLCTGGYHAIRSVVGNTGIHRALAINTFLIWRPGVELDVAAHASSLRSVYMRAPVKARSWIVQVRSAIAPWVLVLKRTLFPDAATRAARAEIKTAAERGRAFASFSGRPTVHSKRSSISVRVDPGSHVCLEPQSCSSPNSTIHCIRREARTRPYTRSSYFSVSRRSRGKRPE